MSPHSQSTELISIEGRKLSITRPGDPGTFEVHLATSKSSGAVSVYDPGSELVAFWRQLAADWRG